MKKIVFLLILFLGSLSNNVAGDISKIYHPQQTNYVPEIYSQQISSTALNSSPSATNGQYVISKSGRYVLSSDIMAAPARSNLAILYIASSDVVLDLAGKSITQSGTTRQGNSAAIELAPNIHNVSIMNGTIKGGATFTSTTTGIKATLNTGIRINNVHVINCATEGISLNQCSKITLDNVHLYNNGAQTAPANTSMARGIVINRCNDLALINSTINNTNALSVPAYGIYASKSNNINISNVQVSSTGSVTKSAQGLFFYNCKGVFCENVEACGQTAGMSRLLDQLLSLISQSDLDTLEPTTASVIAVGFNLTSCSGCKFLECNAINGSSTDFAVGFRLCENSNNNYFYKCSAQNNSSSNIICGFQLSKSHYNEFNECSANGNGGSSKITCGFQSGSNSTNYCNNNLFKKCKANANISTNYNSYGFLIYSSTGTIIQDCESLGNKAGTTSAGIALLGTCIKNIIEQCTLYSNIGTTGSFGLMDAADNSTSLIRGNQAFGQGQCLNKTGSSMLTNSQFMNYLLKYTAKNMKESGLIKEYDISDMNSLTGLDTSWCNVSILDTLAS